MTLVFFIYWQAQIPDPVMHFRSKTRFRDIADVKYIINFAFLKVGLAYLTAFKYITIHNQKDANHSSFLAYRAFQTVYNCRIFPLYTVRWTFGVFSNIIFIGMSALITCTLAVHNFNSFVMHLHWHETVHVYRLYF